jgi:TetR/AcrR family transcriptional regulator, regulator of cefoperazone and chloramphenicol sensitivity
LENSFNRTTQPGKAMDTETTETRTRILEAAAVVFAEHGFAATTIRMICGRAQVNLAAVNYHFGNKEGLYREVLRYVRQCAYDRYPPTSGLTGEATPEQRLHAFIRSFLLRTSGDERNLGFGTLVMRELVEPTTALDMLVDEGIRSLFGQLVDIVRALMGDRVKQDMVLACARSIMSQCLFYLFSRPVISRMAPEHKFNPDNVEMISEQIMHFSLHALRGIAEKR